MKKYLFFTFLLCALSIGAQTTYYANVSGGADFQTLAEINAFSFTTGDQVLLNRGDTFYGTINLTGVSGVTFGAYGTGDDPVISGSKALSGSWLSYATNVWSLTDATLPANVRLLSVDGVDQDFGKWPDVGWREYTNPVLSDSFDDLLGLGVADGFWNGAEAVVGMTQYGFVIENYNVLSQVGNTFNVDGSFYDIFNGSGYNYYIQNHVNTLTLEGEWAFNGTSKTVYLYSSTTPDDNLIEVCNADVLVTLTTCSNLTFNNITFLNSNTRNVSIDGCTNITFDNVLIDHGAYDGIYISNSDGFDFTNSELHDIGNIGIYNETTDNVNIQDNIIHSIGMDRGAGGSNGGQSVGVKLWSGTNIDVSYNEIYDIGYNGVTMINYTCFNTSIHHNYVHHVLLTKSDGGAIYTWQADANHPNGNSISYNIVTDVDTGTDQGMITGGTAELMGIYTDDRSDNITINNNTVKGGKFCIYLHSNAVMTVTANTLYDADMYMYSMKDDNSTIEMDNITSSNNKIIYGINTNSGLYFKNMTDEINGGGVTFNGDIFIDPFNPQSTFDVLDVYNTTQLTNDTWDYWTTQSFVSNQSNASILSADYPAVADADFVYFHANTTKTAQTITVNGGYADLDGNEVLTTTTVQPYESVILFKIDNAASTPTIEGQTSGGGSGGVTNATELNTAISSASPGDVIMIDGNITGDITFNTSGNSSQPITIQNNLAYSFSGSVTVTGNYIEFDGLTFNGGLTVTGGNVKVDGCSINSTLTLNNCSSPIITNNTFTIAGNAISILFPLTDYRGRNFVINNNIYNISASTLFNGINRSEWRMRYDFDQNSIFNITQ